MLSAEPVTSLPLIASPRITQLVDRLQTHPLYGAITSQHALRVFAEHHVFAVWDFMSLLKALQMALTCVRVPWTPAASGRTSRLINEIVLGEESDVLPDGDFGSHFALYRAAMQEIGASTASVDHALSLIDEGVSVSDALTRASAPPAVVPFVRTTFSIIADGRTHATAAAFALGREDLVPQMFQHVARHTHMLREHYPSFFYYLDRHIELDSTSHGPLAQDMVAQLCHGDPRRLADCVEVVERALSARVAFWDDIHAVVLTVPSR